MKTLPKISTKIEVFPYLLMRIAGNPVENIERIINHTSVDDRIIEFQKQLILLNERKIQLSDELLKFTRGIQDQAKNRQTLQDLQPNILNDSKLEGKDLILGLSLLPNNLRQKVSEYKRLEQHNKDYHQESQQLYYQLIRQSREQLQDSMKDEMFLKSITFSSLTFQEQIANYSSVSVNDFRENELQIENGILQYYTRMSMKTTHHSTFTHLSFAKVSNDLLSQSPILGNPESCIALNIKILELFKNLVYESATLRYFQVLSLNPSITIVDEKFRFIIQRPELVSCGSLPFSHTVQYVLDVVSRGKTFQQTVFQISKRFKTTELTIIKYLDKLIDIGLINLTFPIEAFDNNWTDKLLKWLKSHSWIKPAFMLPQIKFLQALIDLEKKLAVADGKQRILILREYVQELSTFEKNEAIKPFVEEFKLLKPEQVFFEDIFLPKASITFNEKEITEITQLSEDLLHYIENHFVVLEATKIDAIWNEFATQQKNEITVVEFFERYLANTSERHFEESNISNYTSCDHWEKSVNQKMIINLEPKDFVITRMPTSEKHNYSKSIFLQYFKNEKGQLSGVMNGVLEGYGRMYSHFLKGFEPNIANDLCAWNERISDNKILAENCDNTFHNDNIHEAVLPFQLLNPESHQLQGNVEAIHISELIIKKIDNKIVLFYPKTGQQVYVFDMGFKDNRSVLYRFLNQFSAFKTVQVNHFCEMLNEIYQQKNNQSDEYIFQPRIQFNKRLIIQRQTWILPHEWLFKKLGTFEDFEFYVALQTLKRAINLPTEMFVSLEGTATNDKKPQYIHLESPLLAEMFKKIYQKAKNLQVDMKITEMAPLKQELYKINNQHYVCEAVPQWYKKPLQ